MTQVSEAMTRGVRTIAPSDTLVEAAQAMDELDVGALPVCDGDKVLGMVTDRDIVVRGVAQGCAIDQAPVSDVMSENVRCCYEDEDIDEVVEQMADSRVRRIPVLDRDDKLVGILSLGDIAVKADSEADTGGALSRISEPAEPDRSGQSQASGAAGGGSASGKARGSQRQTQSGQGRPQGSRGPSM